MDAFRDTIVGLAQNTVGKTIVICVRRRPVFLLALTKWPQNQDGEKTRTSRKKSRSNGVRRRRAGMKEGAARK